MQNKSFAYYVTMSIPHYHRFESTYIAITVLSITASTPRYRFVLDTEWSACSVTCGEGVRRKFWRCKIFLEMSRTVATLRNESHCAQPKPKPVAERCTLDPCSLAYGYDESYPR